MDNHKEHKDKKMDHSKMDHSKMDHSNHDHAKMDSSKKQHQREDHSKMDHGSGDHSGHNPAHGQMGHDHHKMMVKDFRKRFWISLIVTIPILFLSPMIQEFLGMTYCSPEIRISYLHYQHLSISGVAGHF